MVSYIKFMTVGIILIPVLLLGGCGEEKGQPEGNSQDLGVKVDVSIEVLDGNGTTTVDVEQRICDDGTAEDFFDVFANVTFTSTALSSMGKAQTLYLTDYSIDYIPVHTDGFPEDPPPLTSVGPLQKSIVIPPDSEVTFEGSIIMSASISTKYEFVTHPSNYYVNWGQGTYSFRFTFRGQGEYGDEFELVAYDDALWFAYDACD